MWLVTCCTLNFSSLERLLSGLTYGRESIKDNVELPINIVPHETALNALLIVDKVGKKATTPRSRDETLLAVVAPQ
ncbi:hypothetical protein BJX61DRAFT_525109 [Aspergillus egyptiacus]|nr:hypothetical protein BJX61DRAFT_525109 [Aspergillus egyptiacus]